MADYVLAGPRWASRSLTWSYASPGAASDALAPFSSAIADPYKGDVQAAFDAWAAASGLRFTLVPDSPEAGIRVGFGTFSDGQIGQTDSRSDSSGLLPGVVVRVQDPAATPLVPSGTGGLRYASYSTELRQVLTHELGHALGLDHSADPFSVMYATAGSSNRGLGAGDVAGVQALYPRARTSAPASFAVPFAHEWESLVGDADGSVHVSGAGISGAVLQPGVYRVGFLDGTAVFDATGAAGEAARLYRAAFGRAGDAGGVAYWAQALRDGASPLAVARAFADSAEARAHAASDDAGFVAGVYRDALGREPDEGGLRSFTQALAGGTERARVLLDIAGSAEAKAHLRAAAGDPAQASAYRLYDTVLGRAPDAGGLAYFGDLIARGATPTEIARSMLGSMEAASRYGGLSDRDFVASLYRGALDREPDAGGLAWSEARLAQGASRAQVAAGLADSAEARRLTAAATHDGWVWPG